MPKKKNIPMRMCIACNEMKPKKELIRVLKTTEEAIVLDKTGKKNGRGAYLCNSLECFKQARKTKLPHPRQQRQILHNKLPQNRICFTQSRQNTENCKFPT